MQDRKFWSRMVRWLRHGADGGADAVADHGATGSTFKGHYPEGGGDALRGDENQARVANPFNVIEKHLTAQGERMEVVASQVNRLAEIVESLPDVTQRHLALLSNVGEAAAALATGTKRIEERLMPLPELADSQREAMVSIGRQLDEWRQTSGQITAALVEFEQALASLAEAIGQSGKVLQEMRHDEMSREQRVAALLEEQNRRLVVFGWCAIGAAAAAVVLGLIALLV